MNTKSILAITLSLLIFVGCSKYQSSLPSLVQKSEEVIAFQNVNLVPMTDEKIVKNQTVLVKGNRIIEIGPSETIAVPENSQRINGTGAYLMPGLADMHMHTRDNWDDSLSEWPVSPLLLYLANGVTTIRCFGPKGRSPDYVLYWRTGIQKGELIGPAIYTCGEQLRGNISNPEEMVREQKAKGFDFIKLYSFLSKDEFRRAISTAKELNIYTAGHIPFQVGLEGILSEGMDEIAHIEELFWEFVDFDRKRYFSNEHEWMSYVIVATFQQFKPYLNSNMEEIEEILANKMALTANKLKSENIPVCTTLFLDDLIVEKLFEPEKFLSKPENKYLPKSYLDAFEKGREKHQIQFRGGEVFAPYKRKADLMLLHHLKKAGVHLILATDAGTGRMGLVPGFSIHDELRILTENGFTPYEAIKTGTINAAIVVEEMNANGDFGTIEIGKRADLILINDNPLEDVANIKNILGVMASGRWYDKAMLQKFID